MLGLDTGTTTAALMTIFLAIVAVICFFGLHRYWMVILFARHANETTRPCGCLEENPPVTVQIPLYNEGAVAERIIEAACRLEYPRELLQIQVLDDSNDGSEIVGRAAVERFAAQGINIEHIQRPERVGFKAGALDHGMKSATGEFIAIFDADFVPHPSFLRRTLRYFADPSVGVVQTRWAHLNRNASLLTRAQAVFLDGHFVVEHTARSRGGAWINFNGTAGVWRRQAITDAGGWEHDTLTEDVDLSYRAQLKGWRFAYLPAVTTPAELPPTITAFKNQQFRWTKGSIQVAIKLLPRIFRADLPFLVKHEAFFHLASPVVYLFITAFALLIYPTLVIEINPLGNAALSGAVLGLTLFSMGTASAALFYLTSQVAQRRSFIQTVALVPVLMAVGIGISLYNALGVIEALIGRPSPFVRTQKHGNQSHEQRIPWPSALRGLRLSDLPGFFPIMNLLELSMGLYMIACIAYIIRHPENLMGLPFVLLFAAGYLYVALSGLRLNARAILEAAAGRAQAATEPSPVEAIDTR
ncbi:cellulose synthase family protein [Mucisphaera calidilacus]|uniref:Poly-beta-1,6-N-acetyl-D-glucosamine synthase n=1 Tax=Mucisphaera calidilacus TaxID=2527982 RepID=A0A518BZD2_9BACT|nr:cellulose synthase family protein [Mucisphaera calidilacus]QDU72330.1 Poly-beta-1,6-N-acetyl-D-glucosamine synthase [Mucisphaera calidilacus]